MGVTSVIVFNMKRSIPVPLLDEVTITWSGVSIGIITKNTKGNRSKRIGHIVRNRNMRNFRAEQSELIHLLLLDGRLSSSTFDISKFTLQRSRGTTHVPKMPIESFAEGVQTMDRPLCIIGELNRTGSLLEQREDTTPMPPKRCATFVSDF